MSTERRPVAFNKFGGLRLDLPLDEIGGEQACDLLNVDWRAGGVIGPRVGFSHAAGTSGGKDFGWCDYHDSERLLAWRADGKVVPYDISFSAKTAASSTTNPSSSVRFGKPGESRTYIARNGAETLLRYDGAFSEPTCSVDGVTGKAMPWGVFLASWAEGGGRLVVASTPASHGPGGAASSDSHVWFSEAEGKAEAFESTAYVQLDPGDGEKITGMAVFNSQVFVFKQTKLFVFYGISVDEEGRPVFNFRRVELGTVIPRPELTVGRGMHQITVGPDGVYFAARDGVWVTRGSDPSLVSGALAPLARPEPISGPAGTTFANPNDRFFGGAEIFWAASRLFVVLRTVTLVLREGRWTVWSISPGWLTDWGTHPGEPFVLFSQDEFLCTLVLGGIATKDGSTAISARWQSGFYDLGSQDEKDLVGVRAFGSGAIDAESFADLSEDASPSKGHFEFPESGSRSVLDDNALTDSGVMFSHKLVLEPGSRVQRLVRYLRETRTPETKSR